MTKLLNILFLIFCIGGRAQNYSPVIELQFPKQIPFNTSFDISLISDNSFIEADAFNLYIISDNRLDVNSVEALTENGLLPTVLSHSTLLSGSQLVHLAQIKFKVEELLHQSFFQVLMNFMQWGSEVIEISFYGEFIRNSEVIYSIGSLERKDDKKQNSLIAEIKTYKPEKFTRNAAKFESDSNLKIDLSNISASKLWAGFWLKTSGGKSDILKLLNKNSGSTIISIGLNESQKLFISDENAKIINTDAPFLSKKVWYHLGMELNTAERFISFYSSGKLFAKHYFTDLPDLKDMILSFDNSTSNPFTIEQLRIIKLNNGLAKVIENSRYNSVNSKNIELLLQLNFDTSAELLNSQNKFNISYNNLKLVTSDAPIFSRAPELNINLTSSYIQMEWTAQDVDNASVFVIEKSLEENGFIQIASVPAAGDNTKTYNYIDGTDNKSEIVYYRIKQINKDGSVIYSSQVKVGLGTIEQFKLNQNYPNPFNPLTSIELDLFEDSEIEIIIYNIEGQEVVILQKGFLSKGLHRFEFDGKDLPSGVYLYKVASPLYSQTKKMLLTK